MHVFNRIGIFGLIILLNIGILNAGTTGKIVGSIKDKINGEPLIGANIVIENTSLGSATDVDGYFSIFNIPPGLYRMTVYYVGYKTVTIENVRVNVDRTTTQELKMEPAAVEGEAVVVEAERPAIELDKTHSSSVVNAETIELMPVTELDEVLELQGGVVSSGGQLHFRGGRAREVTYIIDGVPVTNSFDQNGGSLVEVDNNMIAELEVISGTFNAEYGSAQSGVVNIVTKKPASKYTGTLEVYAGDWLSSRDDVFLGVTNFDPGANRNLEFSLTGPIISNKLGFLISGRLRQSESLDWFERRYNTIDGWRIAAYQQWAQQQNISTGENTGFIEIPDSFATGNLEQGPLNTQDYTSLQAKLTWSVAPKLTVFLQAFGSLQKTKGPLDQLNTGSDQVFRFAPDDFGTLDELKYSQFVRLQHFPSENFYYNLAFSYQREDNDFYYRKDNKIAMFPGDDGIQLFSANSSRFSLGGTNGVYGGEPGRGYVDQYLGQADFNWQINKHNLLKAGFSFKQNKADIFVRGFRPTPEWLTRQWPLQSDIDPTQLTYDQYWNALIDYWKNWNTTYGNPNTNGFEQFGGRIGITDNPAFQRDFQVEPREGAAYLQDKLELGDIILNAGLRLDIFDPNDVVPINFKTESFNLGAKANLQKAKTKTQVSPRFGISFPISSNGAFHGSYGHFFQMPPYQRMFNEPLNVLTRFQLEGRTLGNADLEAEKTIAYEIGLQQAVTEDIAIDVTAYYKDFKNLLGIEQIQTIDNVTYQRYINRDYGNSKGLTIDITKRHGLVNGGVNFTLSFAKGSSSDPAALFLIQSATSLGGEADVFPERKILSLNWDQRSTVNAFVNFVKPKNWSIGLVGFIDSGQPFSPSFVERFDISAREFRNGAFKPTRWNVDLKAKKHLNLSGLKSSLYLKVDNVFDHLNHNQVFSTTGKADQVARLPEEETRIKTALNGEGVFTLQDVDLFPDFFSSPRSIQLGLEMKF